MQGSTGGVLGYIDAITSSTTIDMVRDRNLGHLNGSGRVGAILCTSAYDNNSYPTIRFNYCKCGFTVVRGYYAGSYKDTNTPITSANASSYTISYYGSASFSQTDNTNYYITSAAAEAELTARVIPD